MTTVHFRDGTNPVECDRAFIAENGWVAITAGENAPVMYPPGRIDRVEGSDDIYYDTAILTEEIGSRQVDDEGHVLREPELVKRLMTEIEVY